VAFATGHARNKMSHADVVGKFRYCVDGRLSSACTDEIIAAVDDLERLPSIRSLTALLS
jgi:hypothetical protein